MIRRLAAAAVVALAFPAAASARGTFDPSTEFEQHKWVSIELGPLDLSITKAVGFWFPYVASLALFIWVVNMLGFLPLPISNEKFHVGGVAIPTFGIYAATSSLSVTLALALLTFVFTHFEGIRWNGPVHYFKSWIPEAPGPALILIVPIEILSQFMRLISLAVRLFANMLAGHMLILTFIGLMFVLENVFLAIVVVPAATAFYLFEVVIVVSIQAFIFAALSAIYIGSAIEPEH